MNLTNLLAALLLISAQSSSNNTMEAREVDVATLRRDVFDLDWRLPEGATDLRAKRGPWLVAEMKALASFSEPETADKTQEARTLGDLIVLARALPRERAAYEQLLERTRKESPDLAAAAEPFFVALLDDAALRDRRWNPDREDIRDGIVFATPWNLKDVATEPWRSLRGSTDVQQAVTLIHADLEAIKEAENDYRAYPRRRGADYEWIGAMRGSFVRGNGDELGPFSALRLGFRCDLPFPFSAYTCDLRVLNRLDGDAHLVTDIYSKSKDFHWMAGRDVFIPVRTSDGRWVATLVVRLFGFDLDGVPDRDGHRRTALRGSLGNLKLEAEASFAERNEPPRTVEGALPRFVVHGLR